jgi:hypothetical protein
VLRVTETASVPVEVAAFATESDTRTRVELPAAAGNVPVALSLFGEFRLVTTLVMTPPVHAAVLSFHVPPTHASTFTMPTTSPLRVIVYVAPVSVRLPVLLIERYCGVGTVTEVGKVSEVGDATACQVPDVTVCAFVACPAVPAIATEPKIDVPRRTAAMATALLGCVERCGIRS